MRNLKVMLLAVICIAALSLSTGNVAAQGGGGGGRGNFDPAQMRQRMLDRLKTQFEVTDDAEWTVLSAAIGKVIDARAAVMSGAVRGGGRQRGGNNGGNGGDAAATDNNNRPQRGGFGGTPSTEATDLQTAIDAKAPADEIKAKLQKLRDSNAANEAKLASAQDDLKKLLTSRQEAIAVLNGLLK